MLSFSVLEVEKGEDTIMDNGRAARKNEMIEVIGTSVGSTANKRFVPSLASQLVIIS